MTAEPVTQRFGADPDELDSDQPAGFLYLRSYLLMRAVIGFLGITLPIVLLVGGILLADGGPLTRESLSGYYYSGMRDVFVGSLCVIGIFLLTYRVFDHTVDNVLSLIAGFAILLVALFSTGRPKNSDIPLTPLQKALGESTVTTIHYCCAAVFILSLAGISYYFGRREGERPHRTGHRSPGFWKRFHWGCAAAIVLAVIFIAINEHNGWFTRYSLIIGESVAVFAFGLSWLVKGLELDVLLGRQSAREG